MEPGSGGSPDGAQTKTGPSQTDLGTERNFGENIMADLALRQIKKAYGSLNILHGIDLDIE